MKKWLAQVLTDDPEFARRFRRARNDQGLDAAPVTGGRDKERVIERPKATGGREAREAVLADEEGALVELVELVGDDGTLADWCRARGLGYTWASTWVKADEERHARYMKACETRAERLIDEIVGIADETPTKTVTGPKGLVHVELDPAGVKRNAERVRARQWLAEKMLRSTYGRRQTVEHEGAGGGPVRHVHELTDDALANIVRLGRAQADAQAGAQEGGA